MARSRSRPRPFPEPTQGHDAYAKAREEHVNRLQLLEIIDSELQEITIGIVSQRR